MAARKDRDSPPALTVGAVARRLGCAESTVRRMADEGLLPSIRDTAGRRLFSEAAVTRAQQGRPRGA